MLYTVLDVTVFLSLTVFQKIIMETLPEGSTTLPIIGTPTRTHRSHLDVYPQHGVGFGRGVPDILARSVAFRCNFHWSTTTSINVP